MTLIPCPACDRHVYTTETSCPFCRHELGALDGSGRRWAPARRMSRAALVVLGMSSVACGGDADESGNSTGDMNTGSTSGSNNGTQGPTTKGSASTNDTTATTMATTTATSAGGMGSDGETPVYGAPATGGSFNAGGSDAGGNGGGGGSGGNGGSGGDGGTGGSSGGSAGDTADTSAGGSSSLPGAGGGGAVPLYGAPPTPGK